MKIGSEIMEEIRDESERGDDAEELNSVPDRRAIEELGEKGLRELYELKQWLEAEDIDENLLIVQRRTLVSWFRNSNLECRTAPALIARENAELFVVSVPRFSFRFTFHSDSGTSLINVRKLGSFAGQVTKWASPVRNRESDSEKYPAQVTYRQSKKGPSAVLGKTTCIGDCVIAVPSRFKTFHILNQEYSRAYGEAREFRGLPYVRNVELSGLCAQAVCFMATALLKDYANGIYGITEITALAKSRNSREMHLRGLSFPKMRQYFEKVGLAADLQCVIENRKQAELHKKFILAIKSYLTSGFPVIIPTDMGRMIGVKSGKVDADMLEDLGAIYHVNGLSGKYPKYPARNIRRRRHVILAVGFKDNQVVFQDPASFPFLSASFSQLNEASCYLNDELSTLCKYNFMSVVPSRVKLRFTQRIRMPSIPQPKQRSLFVMYQTMCCWFHLRLGNSLPSPSEFGDWRLCDPERRVVEDRLIDRCPLSSKTQAYIRSLDRWVWLQRVDDLAWLWDAETEAPSRDEPDLKVSEHLLGLLSIQNGEWSPVLRSGLPLGSDAVEDFDHKNAENTATSNSSAVTEPKVNSASPPRARKQLTPSLITSFATGGIKMAVNRLPSGLDTIDLYAFMQTDLERLAPVTSWVDAFRRRIRFRTRNAFRKLPLYFYKRKPWQNPRLRPGFSISNRTITALNTDMRIGLRDTLPVPPSQRPLSTPAMARVPTQKRSAAQRTIETLGLTKDLRIGGMATFVPDISSSNARQRTLAVRAIRKVMEFTSVLPSRNPKTVVEIVGGSMLDGIWSGLDNETQQHAYVANLRDFDVALDQLLLSLEELAVHARRLKVLLALELEPGPLYVLGNRKRMERVCSAIASRTTLSDVVGVNFDIAHWVFLEGLTDPSEIPAIIRDRIVHAHVSDHADGGHYGDAALCEIHKPEIFMPWIKFLEEIYAERHDGPLQFSGIVAAEIEACKNLGMVNKTVEELTAMLRHHNI